MRNHHPSSSRVPGYGPVCLAVLWHFANDKIYTKTERGAWKGKTRVGISLAPSCSLHRGSHTLRGAHVMGSWVHRSAFLGVQPR
jgi:hypothetical protein